jgi:hypothetical protein
MVILPSPASFVFTSIMSGSFVCRQGGLMAGCSLVQTSLSLKQVFLTQHWPFQDFVYWDRDLGHLYSRIVACFNSQPSTNAQGRFLFFLRASVVSNPVFAGVRLVYSIHAMQESIHLFILRWDIFLLHEQCFYIFLVIMGIRTHPVNRASPIKPATTCKDCHIHELISRTDEFQEEDTCRVFLYMSSGLSAMPDADRTWSLSKKINSQIGVSISRRLLI